MLTGVVSGFGLLVFLLQTKPLELPLLALLLPFGLYLLWVRSSLIGLVVLARGSATASRKLRFSANGLAFITMLLISMQSLGQLSWQDLLLAAGLTGLLMLYFAKSDLI